MSDMAHWCAEQERREKDALESFRTAFGQALKYSRKKHPGFVRDVFRSPGYLRLMLADLRKKDASSQTLLEVLLEESMELCEALMDGDLENAIKEAGQIAAVAARAVGPEGKCLLGKRQGEEKDKVVTTVQTIPEEGATNPPPCDIQGHSEIKKACSVSEQVPEKPVRPKWCKVGQWVRIYGRINRRYLGEITKTIHGSRMVEITVVENGETEKHSCDPTDLRPVRFRLPTLEEAYEFLGKVMAFKGGRRELVRIVDVDDVTGPGGVESMLFINRHPAETLMCSDIDGVPFGIPEIDEEAEKGAQE